MCGNTHRPNTRSAATVRYAEGLMEIEMADIGAEAARSRQSEQRIEVGSIHIDLASGLMHHVAQLDDALLEDTMRGGIGHHDRRQLIMMVGDLSTQVPQVNRAVGGSLHHHNLESRHRG